MLKYLVLALPLLFATGARAASFDCAKAEAADEKVICANVDLNDADVRMATMFDMEVEMVAMGQRDAMRDAQKLWLSKRSQCAGDAKCLRIAYDQRLAELTKVFKEIVARGPF